MRSILFAATALAIAASAALANDLSEANAGMAALDHGDYPKAVTLFTHALAGKLAPADKELAYVKRAQAYLGEKKNNLALADLDKALALDPTDKEAADLKAQAAPVHEAQDAPPPAATSTIELQCTTAQGTKDQRIYHVTVDPEINTVTFDGTIYKDGAAVPSPVYVGGHQFVNISSAKIEFGDGFGIASGCGDGCHQSTTTYSIDRTTGAISMPYPPAGTCEIAPLTPKKF
jgi:hypothetical protein